MDNIEVINETENELEFKVEDESHGVFNALRHILMKYDDVEYAVYNIDHPLTGKPIMTIKTNGVSPRVALSRASQELKDESIKFKKLIDDEL